MTFVVIPGGAFLMGSNAGQDDERPVHRVHVDAFRMSAYPVTRAEYAAFLDDTGHERPRDWHDAAFAGDDRPVVGVSWLDADAYCAWRTRQGSPERLPTEAEWERAARAGRDAAVYPWGDEIPAWIPGGGRGPLAGPWPVTLGEPNAYGLYGIAANVHEWCADWHAADYYAASPAVNPSGPPTGRRRSSRGGSWRHAVTISRCAARSKIDPAFRYTDYGFRTVRDL
jgi:formylglycine-generating enzyme required for sulfatase activity